MPTFDQAIASVLVCQMLSNLYQPINVFRDDVELKISYIQAGLADEYAIIIEEDRNWEFVP